MSGFSIHQDKETQPDHCEKIVSDLVSKFEGQWNIERAIVVHLMPKQRNLKYLMAQAWFGPPPASFPHRELRKEHSIGKAAFLEKNRWDRRLTHEGTRDNSGDEWISMPRSYRYLKLRLIVCLLTTWIEEGFVLLALGT